MGSASDPAWVCYSLSIDQNNVRLSFQFLEGSDNCGTLSEKQITGYIGEFQLFLRGSLLHKRQLRIAIQTDCCIYPALRKRSINACDIFRFLV